MFCFCFISRNNPETILKRFRIVWVFCFCFISQVTTSEIKLKQNCFVSVLFQFYFRCNHCFTVAHRNCIARCVVSLSSAWNRRVLWQNRWAGITSFFTGKYPYMLVCSDESNSVVVTTAPSSDSSVNQLLVISIILNDGSALVTTYKFAYRLDPRFTNIEPRNHLIVYVLGSSFMCNKTK